MKKLKIKSHFNFLWLFAFFVLLYTFFTLHHQIVKTNYQEGKTCIIGVLTQVHQTDYGYSFLVKAKETILASSKNLSYQLGDQIEVCGTFTKPTTNTHFHLFSYRNYLLSKRIVWQMEVETTKLVKKDAHFPYVVKRKIENYLDSYQSASYLKTFLLGDTSFLEKMEVYQKLGISHLFSVSGMHVHFLSSMLYTILSHSGKRKHHDIFVLCFLFGYSWLTGFSPSILRATFLFFFCTLKKWFSFSLPNHTFLFLLFLLFLLINPYLLYHSGFLYSFSISFVLLYYQNILEKKPFWKKLFLTSTIAFLVGIPISLIFQFELNPLSIFYNLFFIPFVSFLIFPFCFLVLFFPFLDSCFCFLIFLLENMALFFQTFHFTMILGYPSYFLPFYLFACSLAMKGILYKKTLFLIPLLLCVLLHGLSPYLDGNGYVTMLNVNQGDSILLELPYREGVFLIDTGGNAFQTKSTISKNILIPYLKERGIRNITTLILSHGAVWLRTRTI